MSGLSENHKKLFKDGGLSEVGCHHQSLGMGYGSQSINGWVFHRYNFYEPVKTMILVEENVDEVGGEKDLQFIMKDLPSKVDSEVDLGDVSWDENVEIIEVCLKCPPQQAHELRHQHELPLNLIRP